VVLSGHLQQASGLVAEENELRTAGPSQDRRRFRDCPFCLCGTFRSTGETGSFSRGTEGSNPSSSSSESIANLPSLSSAATNPLSGRPTARLLAGWVKMPGERDCFARFEKDWAYN
jgi:hypothetical protein